MSANLERETPDPGQPTALDGHDFYAGRLEGRGVILAIAGPSPAITSATTELALKHFSCISAVVFEGTAGGGGVSGLGDVTAPARWTANDGQRFTHDATSANVSAKALTVARSIAARASSELRSVAAVDDGPCACSGTVDSLEVVPTLRKPAVLVGGAGETDDTGAGDSCSADGGMLEGCNPCPPGTTEPALAPSDVTAGATTASQVAEFASLAAADGVLVPSGAEALAAHPAPPPLAAQSGTTAGTDFVADDQQTTASMAVAQRYHIPFIAFRGISDTTAVGDLWPFEYLVYQQLAADNAAVAARLWIASWNGRALR